MTMLYRAILVTGFMATAILADIDLQRMQRDIRIMEGVLSNQNLYYDVPDGANFRARGLYLDSYGVLFVAAGPAPGVERWDKSLFQELLATTRDRLAEFLGNYAGIIGQLDKDDQITVCYQPHLSGLAHITVKVDTDSSSFDITTRHVDPIVVQADTSRSIIARIHDPPHRPAADAVPLISATAKKSAIDAFREGRIDSATFRQRIAFSERTDSKKINIMAGILDQVLGRDHHPLVGSQRTLGTYQPGLGALFLINESVFLFSPLSIDAVKANIVEAVADYGAPLGQVQSDEYVIVEYRFNRAHLLQVPKSAIDAYVRGDLELDAFREKAVWKTQ